MAQVDFVSDWHVLFHNSVVNCGKVCDLLISGLRVEAILGSGQLGS